MNDFTDDLRERQKAEEAKWRRSQDQMFKLRCARNRLFGTWAAERQGLPAAEAAAYVCACAEMDLARGEAAMVDKVAADLHVDRSEAAAALARCAEEARALSP